MAVKIGDKVKLDYIYDCNPHNGKVGVVSDVRTYKYYPNGDINEFVMKQSCIIKYPDNTEEYVQDTERKGSGVVSPLIKVEEIDEV